ncbi:precorrin-6y C5,15-methyltransferase (decarboxylating) subunit CbiE [Inediibacterium massiliense]|uniref:precorrin-6y C5,15-methyltransferase (decarboxylating) subunit CbiE n=1 Tax=Inediibacterium massiliense TaxID=1658111 RepID=UPI0006B44989|nr:precorrin-6y C5,15-methyltransferase (decarboxylating) subunit CbiE [Inediibacterium massiliense]
MGKIYILGIGPGHKDYILPAVKNAIYNCDVLIGGKRHLEDFKDLEKEMLYIGSNLKELIEYTKQNKENKKIAYLLSGDTGFYSMLGFLKKHFKSNELEVIPGISSYQYLMAKVGQTWHDAYIGSLHGREFDFLDVVKKYKKVILLTDQKYSPKEIARKMLNNHIQGKIMIIGENLSYPNEKITFASLEEVIHISEFNMCVVVIVDELEI